jgi:hypothetical protein
MLFILKAFVFKQALPTAALLKFLSIPANKILFCEYLLY